MHSTWRRAQSFATVLNVIIRNVTYQTHNIINVASNIKVKASWNRVILQWPNTEEVWREIAKKQKQNARYQTKIWFLCTGASLSPFQKLLARRAVFIQFKPQMVDKIISYCRIHSQYICTLFQEISDLSRRAFNKRWSTILIKIRDNIKLCFLSSPNTQNHMYWMMICTQTVCFV